MNKAYEIVLGGIEEAFREGSLNLGDRLPGERALAERFGVSRASVREALRILDSVGLVRSGVGSGPDAGSIIVSEPASGLSRALKLHVSARHIAPADVIATRLVLESDAVVQAAAARSRDPESGAEHLSRAKRLLTEMDDPDVSRDTFHVLDSEFHRELCAAAGNPVTDIILDSLSSSVLDYVTSAAGTIETWETVQNELKRQHSRLYASIVAGDPVEAQQECETHIRWFARAAGVTEDELG